MSDMRHNEAENTFELEVSPLDDAPASAGQPSSAEPASSVEEFASPVSQGSARGSSSRGRFFRASTAILIVALAVVVIFASFPTITSQAGVGFGLPVAMATLSPGSDIILLAHVVPWGALRIDGRTDVASDLGDYNGYHSYKLPPGQHMLDYGAAPFPPTHCIVSVPAKPSDTCKAPSNRVLAGYPIGKALRAFDMNATVSTMDSREREKLQGLLEEGSSYPAITVEPGMHYLDQNGNVAVAHEQMAVTMWAEAVQPATDTAFDDEGQPCGEYCVQGTQFNTGGWILTVRAGLRWQYTTANGASFTTHSTGEPGIASAYVTYSNESWSLVEGGSIQTDTCLSSFQLDRILEQAISGVSNTGAWIANPPSANGCVLEFSPQNNAGAQPPAQILLRLGIASAVNADAQGLFPNLPVANAAERAIAQAIRTGQG